MAISIQRQFCQAMEASHICFWNFHSLAYGERCNTASTSGLWLASTRGSGLTNIMNELKKILPTSSKWHSLFQFINNERQEIADYHSSKPVMLFLSFPFIKLWAQTQKPIREYIFPNNITFIICSITVFVAPYYCKLKKSKRWLCSNSNLSCYTLL